MSARLPHGGGRRSLRERNEFSEAQLRDAKQFISLWLRRAVHIEVPVAVANER